MSMQSTTRSGGNASGLAAGSLTRRSALRGSAAAAAVALSAAALGGSTILAQAASVAVVPSASPDADLIAHADRLVALAQRCSAVIDHRITLEDRVFTRCARPAPLPQPGIGNAVTEVRTPTERVIALRQPIERDPAWVRWEEDTAAAQAAHEQQKAAMEARLGLPEVIRRAERMERRRDRWAIDLAAMKPATPDGLSVKTAALLVLLGKDRASLDSELAFRADLTMAVLTDVVRLGAGGQA